MFERYTKILACPDCRGIIRTIDINQRTLGFFCEACNVIYPVKDDIPLLLPKRARNYGLEYELIENNRNEASNHSISWLEDLSKTTLDLLEASKNAKSWEWEDEEFWSKEYQKESKSVILKNWNDRIWQRVFLVKSLVSVTDLNGKTILDVGCGEGQNFRLRLSKYCDETTLYIAGDISIEGLKRNRSHNRHNKSLSVLCSADSLPFHRQTIDILCYFGILNHTERKAGTIPEDSKLVKNGGYILIHEALEWRGSSLMPNFLKSKTEESAHEERIKQEELLLQVRKVKNIEIVADREMHTIFFAAIMRFMGNVMTRNKALFCFILDLDILFIKLFGGTISLFKPAGIMLLVRKNSNFCANMGDFCFDRENMEHPLWVMV